MTEIFNIERFATHDGPGIRTAVFFKGCGMHCPWCANPESWGIRPVLMHDAQKCSGCGQCAAVCPVHAIQVSEQWTEDPNLCTACHRCEESCLNDAISFAGESMTTEEIMQEVLKDLDYYQRSGGGLTVSGGEAFLQKDGLIELLELAHQNGLHTAVETAGFCSHEAFSETMPLIDLFLFDMKHADAEVLRTVTGADMKIINANLEILAQNCPERVIIRIPVIPGFNREHDIVLRILDKVKSYGFTRADLLPYHTLAKVKWNRMQREYPYGEDQPLQQEDLKQMMEYGIGIGLDVRIGG
ncbi:MAG: glycyl-radical enzyme activating protein [Erysipelotrichia bacterium]|nr:glycyl-radical enzyme activating protein [Erysipelotrichia bacterium]